MIRLTLVVFSCCYVSVLAALHLHGLPPRAGHIALGAAIVVVSMILSMAE